MVFTSEGNLTSLLLNCHACGPHFVGTHEQQLEVTYGCSGPNILSLHTVNNLRAVLGVNIQSFCNILL